jgi:hypothetical protein
VARNRTIRIQAQRRRFERSPSVPPAEGSSCGRQHRPRARARLDGYWRTEQSSPLAFWSTSVVVSGPSYEPMADWQMVYASAMTSLDKYMLLHQNLSTYSRSNEFKDVRLLVLSTMVEGPILAEYRGGRTHWGLPRDSRESSCPLRPRKCIINL